MSGYSTLADHRQQGRTLKPPLLSLPVPTQEQPWWRDLFPDMIWLCALVHHLGERESIAVTRKVTERLSKFVPKPKREASGTYVLAAPLTGALSSFDLVPKERQQEALAALKADGLYEVAFPWLLVRALSKYDGIPGAWILGGWEGDIPTVGADEPEKYLGTVAASASGGQTSVATLAKSLWVRAVVEADMVRFNSDLSIVDLLPRYPFGLTEDERAQAESGLRAMFGVLYGILNSNGQGSTALAWAKTFWRQNWRLYDCVTSEKTLSSDVPEGSAAAWKEQHAHWSSEIERIEGLFHDAWQASDPDLYAPDRHEVLTGMTYRHIRAVDAMTRYPGFWTTEHGAPIIRNLAEARIVLAWLVKQDDADNYQRFKNYGRGHLKLQVLHLREYRENLEDNDPDLDAQIEYLERLLNRDRMEEFQEISIEGNFVKKNVRDMARETGLENEYRMLFAPMSADVHGEWAPLDRYVLSPCLNPLHRQHRIPNMDTRVMLGPELVDTAIGLIEAMVTVYSEGVASCGGGQSAGS